MYVVCFENLGHPDLGLTIYIQYVALSWLGIRSWSAGQEPGGEPHEEVRLLSIQCAWEAG